MTRGRGRAAVIALFFLSSVLVFSLDEEELPFPFVSLLKAEVAGFQIKLSWRDAPETVTRYLVYRYTEELTAENLAMAQMIGQVAPGVQFFIDTPPDEKAYFYSVLAQDSGGKMFSTLIPFRNKTLAGVAVTTPATEEQAAARISGIHAAPIPGSDGIEVTFQSSNPGRDLLLFRSTAPIMIAEDLLRSASATQLDAGTTQTAVPVLPGVDYWFTVVDAGLYKLGRVPLARGTNTTLDPVQIPVGNGSASLPPMPPRRPLPLPSLEITYGIQTGRQLPGVSFPGLPPERSISAATRKALSILLAAAPRPLQKEMVRTVLPSEATPSPDSEEALLQAIVKGPFMSGDVPSAEGELLDFLSLRRAADVQARAHYYLGQAYFFDKRPREALLEFLLAEDPYYHEVDQWKDACFQQLEKEDD